MMRIVYELYEMIIFSEESTTNVSTSNTTDENDNSHLVSHLTLKKEYFNTSIEDIEFYNQHLESGGHYRPQNCLAHHRIAVIVPYRDRPEHLVTFLDYMHGFLQKQHIEYAIFVIELVGNVAFLLNAFLFLNWDLTML